MKTTQCTKHAGSNHLTGYRTDGCRCPDCTEANRAAMMRWRRNTGRNTRTLVPVEDANG